MKFTMANIALSLANHLAEPFPDVTFFEDPNQQGSTVPCMFVQSRFSNIKPRISGRIYREIGLDLVYLEQFDRTDLQRLYTAAAEKLDYVMEAFPYSDGTDTAILRTYKREWTIGLDDLHYKFELHVWETPEDGGVKMEEMDYEQRIKENG